jgi:tetratricopeptide (TPR) repeat protein
VRITLLLLCAALGGCASAPPPAPPDGLFRDASFRPPSEPVNADDLFTLSDAMRHYADVEIAAEVRHDGATHALIDDLYRRDRLQLDYDAAITRNAAEAFAARKGNCLSLVIMTAAFAKHLGMDVTYQTVAIDETWSRTGDLAFLSGHVNLTLSKRRTATSGTAQYDRAWETTVDFLPQTQLAGARTEAVPEETVVAMYMNNRAAEALAQGHIDDAYWWARGATLRAPGFDAPVNTLAVVYLRHGDYQAAESVLDTLIARAPRDVQALSNLAIVLDKEGRGGEAGALRDKLARMEPLPPFHFLMLGIAAMRRGDVEQARGFFAQEVARADYCSECHFWLGIADFELGRLADARKQLELARDDSATGGERAVYAAKLARLRSFGVQ